MMVLAIASLAAMAPGPGAAASVEAIATIRVLSGATVHLQLLSAKEPVSLRLSGIRAADGSVERLRIVDFQ